MSAAEDFRREISACTGLREGALDRLVQRLLVLADQHRRRGETCACGDAAAKAVRRFNAIASKLDGCLADWPKELRRLPPCTPDAPERPVPVEPADYEALRRLALSVRTEARLRAERNAAHRPRDDRRDRLMEEALELLDPHVARYAPGLSDIDRRFFLHRAVAAVLKEAGAKVPHDIGRDAAKFDRAMRRRKTDRAARQERLKDVVF